MSNTHLEEAILFDALLSLERLLGLAHGLASGGRLRAGHAERIGGKSVRRHELMAVASLGAAAVCLEQVLGVHGVHDVSRAAVDVGARLVVDLLHEVELGRVQHVVNGDAVGAEHALARLGRMRAAVDVRVAQLLLIGPIGLEVELALARRALEARAMVDGALDRTDALQRVHLATAARALGVHAGRCCRMLHGREDTIATIAVATATAAAAAVVGQVGKGRRHGRRCRLTTAAATATAVAAVGVRVGQAEVGAYGVDARVAAVVAARGRFGACAVFVVAFVVGVVQTGQVLLTE